MARDNGLDGFQLLASSYDTLVGDSAVANGARPAAIFHVGIGFEVDFGSRGTLSGDIAVGNVRDGFAIEYGSLDTLRDDKGIAHHEFGFWLQSSSSVRL
jgi:hypothetical protein